MLQCRCSSLPQVLKKTTFLCWTLESTWTQTLTHTCWIWNQTQDCDPLDSDFDSDPMDSDSGLMDSDSDSGLVDSELLLGATRILVLYTCMTRGFQNIC